MFQPRLSRNRAKSYAAALFLLGLAALAITESWWPSIMLVAGLSLGLYQFLLGRIHDTIVTLMVFVGTFVTEQFDISWRILMPILFILAAIYILTREFMEASGENEEEIEEDTNLEIEEKKKRS